MQNSCQSGGYTAMNLIGIVVVRRSMMSKKCWHTRVTGRPEMRPRAQHATRHATQHATPLRNDYTRVWNNLKGNAFYEDARTIDVSVHGALLC